MNTPVDPGISAAHLLVVGGVGYLAFSFLLGWVLAARRARAPIDGLRWLLVAHEVALQEGLMLLGLAFALGFTRLPPNWSVAAAWLLIAAALFQTFSGIVNWLRATGDQFAEKSTGWVLASINAVLNTAGLAIVVGGVLRAL